MSLLQQEIPDNPSASHRWKELYTIGGITYYILALLVLAAVIAFFIWPYKPGFTSTENVFQTLQANLLGGLIALDILYLVATILSVLPVLALYMALKQVNETYALIALVLGIIAVVSLVPSRPLAELVTLSDRYAAATTEILRSQYLAAGEALLTQFNGTAWMVNVVLSSVSGLISSLLMLRGRIFHKASAYLGIFINIAALCFFIPGVGIILLFLATVGGIVWQVMVGRRLMQMGRVTHAA